MATATIPVDLFNPGQVFACLGLAELAETLIGPTMSAFDWSDANTRFVLAVDGDADPVRAALGFLAEAEVEAIAPHEPPLDTAKWGVSSHSVAAGHRYPSPPPPTPASLPAILRRGEHSFTIASWAEGRTPGKLGTSRDNVKFWAGSGGYPGAALLRDALDAVRPHLGEAIDDPFALSAPQNSSFRFDWRRDYIPIDIGFSLNAQGNMQPRGFPLVEILAAIGLAHARPERIDKLHYRYAVAGRADPGAALDEALLPLPFVRAALGTAPIPFPTRTFRMHLDWPGQENQARCITTVHEETAR